jgi:hypothetical protein
MATLALLSTFSWWGVLMQERLTPPAPPPAAAVDFRRDIQPIFERRCQPCHFPGGKMHARLPFDKAETIKTLGTRLFSRIKKEDERLLIEKFLAQPAK